MSMASLPRRFRWRYDTNAARTAGFAAPGTSRAAFIADALSHAVHRASGRPRYGPAVPAPAGPGRSPRRLGAAVRRRINWVLIPANRAVERFRPLEPPIWIVGDGRSGTTWVTNAVNYRNTYRYLFEPFHPDFVAAAAPFGKYRYLRPGERHHDAHEFAAAVFDGRVLHRRVDKLNRSFVYRGLLIKDIFTQLALGWTDEWFPDVRKILLLRHPFAVALSKVDRSKWRWVRDPDVLLGQRDLVADHLGPFADVLRAADTEFERHVAIWSAVHRVPLAQLAPGRVLLVFYEEMHADPAATLARVRAFIGSSSDDTSDPRLQRVLARASETSGAVSGRDNTRGVDDWRSRLAPDQIRRGLALLDALGMGEIYGDDAMPDRAAAEMMLTRNAPAG
jgi:hypothetical protein